LFCSQFRLQRHYPSDVATRLRQALHIAACDRIKVDGPHDDRNGSARRYGDLQRNFSPDHDQQFHVRPHQVSRFGEIYRLDSQVLAHAEAGLFQFIEERRIAPRSHRIVKRVPQKSDPGRLHSARFKRPRNRSAAEHAY
jgi:hypothetical protein